VTYSVLLADPPWRYDYARTKSRRVENHYPTMALADICALDVASLAAVDAVLFLWATNPKLEEALSGIRAWGFSYRTNAAWVKPQMGMGYYFRQQHELLLVATRGTPKTPLPANRPRSVMSAPRQAHSKKPEIARELIERMYPDARRLEMFAREQRPGWDVWGNEVVSDVALTGEAA
jgi:N6-adenosine-specific RNA methylase IME4